jgi:hypothetical protein
MPNAWLNHVRKLRKNNRNMSYKQLLKHAKNSYSGGADPAPPPSNNPVDSAMKMLRSVTGSPKQGGSPNTIPGFESRSSLTRSASSVGGRRRSSRKTRRRRR